jgi:YVTN family beta-propeller protein
VAVGTGPYTGIAYDNQKGEVFVADYGSDNVSVISDSSDTVVATIPVGTAPWGVAYDSGKGEEFVTSGNNVSVVSDTSNSVVSTIPVGSSPEGIVYDNVSGQVYVADSYSNNVDVISDASDTVVATVSVGSGPDFGTYDAGNGNVYVANYNGASVSILVAGAAVTLSSVAVRPASTTLSPTGTQTFAATPTCNATCPTGIAYSWTLTKSTMGAFNVTTGASVTFTAGVTAGTVDLFVNATLDGATVQSPAVPITITSSSTPTLASVSVSPSSETLAVDGSETFVASPTCSGGSCPSGTTYAWSLTNLLGSLSSQTGSMVTFTAGNTAGAATLFVNATLNGLTKGTSASVTIRSSGGEPSPGQPKVLGLPTLEAYGLLAGIGVVVVLGVAAALLLAGRARKTEADKAFPESPKSPPQPGAGGR